MEIDREIIVPMVLVALSGFLLARAFLAGKLSPGAGGELSRRDSPIWFWFFTSLVAVGFAIGLVALIRAIL